MGQHLRQVLGFFLAAVILIGVVLLFLTPIGLEAIFPVVVRLRAEKCRTESNTYAVYYDMRSTIADADLIVVGVDPETAESYDLLGHFSRFVKQYNNYSDVMADFGRIAERVASGMMNEISETRFQERLKVLQENGGLSVDACDFLSELFVVNTTMVPVRKFDIVSYSSDEYSDDTGLAEKVAQTFESCERSAFCIVDAVYLSSDESFREELDGILEGRKIVYIQTCYTQNSAAAHDQQMIGFPLAGSDPTVYFLNNRDFEWFYACYRYVSQLFGTSSYLEDPLDLRFTDTFFIVTNATKVKYIEPEAEEAAE